MDTGTRSQFLPRRPLVPVCIAFMAGILLGPATQSIPLSVLLAALGVAVVASVGAVAATRPPWVSLVPLAAIAVLGIVRHRVFDTYTPWHLSRWQAEDTIVYVRGIVVEEPLTVNRGTREATTGTEVDAVEGTPQPREESASDAETAGEDKTDAAPQYPDGEEQQGMANGSKEAHGSREFATSFVVDASSLRFPGDDFWRPVAGLMLVKFFGRLQGLEYGTELRMLGRLKGLPAPRNPGERDFRATLELRGIYRQFAVSKRRDIDVEGQGGGGLIMQAASDLRRKMSEAVEKHVSPDQRPLVACMLLGMRRAVSDEIEENMQMTGTIHILSVSGLHVCMLAGFFVLVLRLLMVPRRPRAALGIMFLAAYCIVAGAQAPVVRASVMTGTVFLAQLLRRRADFLNLIALSALAILVIRPTQLYEVGFQLSFAAVLCLLSLGSCFQGALTRLLGRSSSAAAAALVGGPADGAPGDASALEATTGLELRRRVLDYLGRWLVFAFARSAAVWAGMVALTLFYFNLVTPIAVLANIILAPLVFLFLAFGLATVLVSFVLPSIVAAGLGWCTAILGRAIEGVAGGMAAVPGGSFFFPAPSQLTVVAFYGALVFLLVSVRVRKCLFLALCGALVCLSSVVHDYWPASRAEYALKATVLDVGHGLSVLIETADGVSVLYDAGGTRFLDVGRQAIAPFLWHEKKGDIDLLLLSHADLDHISGVPSLFRRFGVGQVRAAADFDETAWRSQGASAAFVAEFRRKLKRVQPPDIERPTTAAPGAAAGDCIAAQSDAAVVANLDFLWPDDRIAGNGALSRNNRSLVVRISCRGRSVLLPGDVEQEGLRRLCESARDLGADVLILPHHGGASSWLPEFARRVQAKVAIASRRVKMAEHGATAATAEAYSLLGARVVETVEAGAVTVTLWQDGRTEVETFLRER